jgi:hypothetical protein
MCGVSAATIRRRKDVLTAQGATTADAGWTIPIPTLVAVGLLGAVSPPDAPPMGAATAPTVAAALREQLDAEHLARITAEHRAELAEAIAEERARNLEDVRRALRVLTAGGPVATPPPPTAAPADEQAKAPAATPTRRWWRRQPAGNMSARLPHQARQQSQGL